MISLYKIIIKWPAERLILQLETLGGSEGDRIQLPTFSVESAFLQKTLFRPADDPMSYHDDMPPPFFKLHLRENAEYIFSAKLPGSITEILSRREAVGSSAWPFFSDRLSTVIIVHPRSLWREETDQCGVSTNVTGKINFHSHVGIADLSLTDSHGFYVEVASRKISHFTDFGILLDSLAKQLVDLAIQVGEVTGTEIMVDDRQKPNDTAIMFHLRRLFGPDILPSAIATIIGSPHMNLISKTSRVEPARTQSPDIQHLMSDLVLEPMVHGGPLSRLFRGYTPCQITDTRRVDTIDTPENQYVKNFLEDLLAICTRISNSLILRCTKKDDGLPAWSAALGEVVAWIDLIDDWLSEPLWHSVSSMRCMPSNSQVLQKRSGYRDVLHADIALQTGMSIPWHPEQGIEHVSADIRPIHSLYQFWCLFCLRDILRNLLGQETHRSDLWKVSGDRLQVNLRQGTKSKLCYQKQTQFGCIEVDLLYNMEFRPSRDTEGSYSANLKPDFTLGITPYFNDFGGLASDMTSYIHWDAKYRLDRFVVDDTNNDEPYDEYEARGTHKFDDLMKMHAYKDAIRRSLGAFILYPGSEKRICSYSNTPLPGVGAFPLRPSKADMDLQSISDHISSWLDHLESLWELNPPLRPGELIREARHI